MKPLLRLQLPSMLPGLLSCLPLCLLMFLPPPLVAQSTEMPGWVVPVLRLVSVTHVEPTTGVVLSCPCRTMPSESPTRMVSAPAWLTRRAKVAS